MVAGQVQDICVTRIMNGSDQGLRIGTADPDILKSGLFRCLRRGVSDGERGQRRVLFHSIPAVAQGIGAGQHDSIERFRGGSCP